MKNSLIGLFAITGAVVASPALAQDRPPPPPPASQIQCGSYGDFSSVLVETYGEEIIFQGIDEGGMVATQVWLNPTTETWSILRVRVGGVACAVSSGVNGVRFPLGSPT
jgi:hypothetical protein